MSHIQLIDSLDQILDLREEWSSLFVNTPRATLFQSSEWLIPWWKHLFCGGRIRTIASRDRGRLIGLLPMFVYGRGSLAIAGAGVSDYLDLLGTAPDLDKVIGEDPAWTTAEWHDVPEGSDLLGLVPSSPSAACPLLALPRSWEAFQAALSPKFRHNLRNATNRLQREGAMIEAATPGTVEEFLDALFRLHEARWRAKGDPGVLADGATRAFHTDVCRGFSHRGWLRLHGLRLDGELRAVIYAFARGPRTYYYQGGFDPEIDRYSPGTVLIGHAIRCAIEEGCREFDFLRHREAYKYRWGAQDRWTRQMRFSPADLRRDNLAYSIATTSETARPVPDTECVL